MSRDPESPNIGDKNVQAIVKNCIMPRSKKENHSLNDKSQSTNTNMEMCHMLELFDEDFYAAIKRTLQQALTNSLEANKK